ncbi:uncharacterized protein LOC144093953 isoform X2 [Amblyomma americanum]
MYPSASAMFRLKSADRGWSDRQQEKSSVLPDGVLGSGGHTHRAPPCGLDTCTAMLRTLTPFAFITQPAHHVFVRHQIERRAVGPLTGLPRKFKCLSPRGN